MQAIAFRDPVAPARVAFPTRPCVDPLDPDTLDDPVVVTTRRGLVRLAVVAAETASRFGRDGMDHDPMDWLLEPRRLFRGEAALDACLARDDCVRAVLLHGLSLELDIPRDELDELLADGAFGEEPEAAWPERDRPSSLRGGGRPRLYTATVVVARGGELLHAFHASVAPSAAVVRERIRARLGSAAAESAQIRLGFDPEAVAHGGLVPPAVLDALACAGRRGRWTGRAGIDVTVERRLAS